MDTGSRWFSNAEINQYLDNWIQELQQEFEFVWAISTLSVGTVTSPGTHTVGTNTYYDAPRLIIPTSTFTPGMLRNEAVYYNGFRLSGRNLQDLEVGDPVWRGDLGNGAPPLAGNPLAYDIPRLAVMYPDSERILIWPTPPPPTGTQSNQFIFEYPALLSFTDDTSTSGLPVWTQYTAKPYVCSRLFQRHGPISDLKKAARYRAQYKRAELRVRRIWDNFLPERYRRLVPGNHYEWEILCPPPAWSDGGNTTNTATGTTSVLHWHTLTSNEWGSLTPSDWTTLQS